MGKIKARDEWEELVIRMPHLNEKTKTSMIKGHRERLAKKRALAKKKK